MSAQFYADIICARPSKEAERCSQPKRMQSGARIEENLLVTHEGHRILGKPRPRTVEEVEAVRRS